LAFLNKRTDQRRLRGAAGFRHPVGAKFDVFWSSQADQVRISIIDLLISPTALT
jgi:hypothetical protein